MSMEYPPPPPSRPPEPSAEPPPPAYPLPTSNVQPVAPPVPYIPPPPTYQPAPPPHLQQTPYAAYRLPKNKTTAVLLAIFLYYVTWMYTYERDAWKFWTAFAITLADTFLSFVTLGFWLFLAIPVGIGIWIWAVIDTAARPQQFYDSYPAA